MDTVASKKLTREGAMKVLGAAVDISHALDCHVSIAVVDDAGHLIVFTRKEPSSTRSRSRRLRQERGVDEISLWEEKPHWQRA
jgi:Haem-degrading